MSLKKILSLIIFIFIIFIIQGCKKENTEILDILNKFKNIEAIDMNYNITLKDNVNGNKSYDEYIYKMKKDKDNFYGVSSANFVMNRYYYVNDYKCNYIYEIELLDDKSEHGTKYFNIDLKNVKYYVKSKNNKDGSTNHTLIAHGNKITKQLELFTKVEELDSEARLELKLVMDNDKLKEMNIEFKYDIDDTKYTYKIDIVINAINESVQLEIPQLVFLQIQRFEEEKVDHFPNRVITQNNNSQGIITNSADGKLKTLEATKYSLSTCDDKYIYTVDKGLLYLNVFEIETLKRVKREIISNTPKAIDAYNGKLVLGFENELKIYDTSTWEYDTFTTRDSVKDLVIYKNLVFYSDNYVYNLTTKKSERYYDMDIYWTKLTINREEGIMYYSKNSDLYIYDITLNEKRTYPSLYNPFEIKFDGNFIHVNRYLDGIVFDKKGEEVSRTPVARLYHTPGVNKAATIYDDRLISIFLGKRDNNYVTIVYDLVSEKILYEYIGTSTKAIKQGNKYIIFDEDNNIIRTLSVDL